jgi:hypothetical protein
VGFATIVLFSLILPERSAQAKGLVASIRAPQPR